MAAQKRKPQRMGELELAQAREAARKPWRFESTHPMKWSDMVDRLLAHIDYLEQERTSGASDAPDLQGKET